MTEYDQFSPDDEDLYVLSDDDGEELSFHQLGRIEVDGTVYALLTLVDDEEDSIMVFTVDMDDEGEEVLNPADEEISEDIFYLYLSEKDDYEYGPAE